MDAPPCTPTYLHDGSVDDDEVLGRGLDRAALPRVAGVEEQRGALQAHPVALPPALPGQLNLKMNQTHYYQLLVVEFDTCLVWEQLLLPSTLWIRRIEHRK